MSRWLVSSAISAGLLAPGLVLAATPGGVPNAMPLPGSSFVPFQAPTAGSAQRLDQATDTEMGPVQTFDPSARAQVIAMELPRQWSGTYQPFAGGTPVSVQLDVTAVTAIGQMLDLRGQMTVGSVSLPVQGNLNASSDQLDLLLLGDVREAGLEDGGLFLGLQGFTLAGWTAPRLTNPGGQLVLNPVGAGGTAPAVRGLW